MNIRELIIIGAGGFGREVFEWARASEQSQSLWRIKGFLDDAEPSSLRVRPIAPLLGRVVDHTPKAEELYVCAIGTPELRRRFQQQLTCAGAEFTTIIHPSAIVCSSAKIGNGSIICPYAIVSADAEIGEGATVYYHTSIDHDATIGRYCQISGHCDITGGAALGEEVFLGSHVVILPGVKIGDAAIVGAGSVVTKDVPAQQTVVGVPAKTRAANRALSKK